MELHTSDICASQWFPIQDWNLLWTESEQWMILVLGALNSSGDQYPVWWWVDPMLWYCCNDLQSPSFDNNKTGENWILSGFKTIEGFCHSCHWVLKVGTGGTFAVQATSLIRRRIQYNGLLIIMAALINSDVIQQHTDLVCRWTRTCVRKKGHLGCSTCCNEWIDLLSQIAAGLLAVQLTFNKAPSTFRLALKLPAAVKGGIPEFNKYVLPAVSRSRYTTKCPAPPPVARDPQKDR